MVSRIPSALQFGLWSVAVYAVVLHTVEWLGYSLAPVRVPQFCYNYWAVLPGAIVLALVVDKLAQGNWRRGALWGGLLAPLNVPFAVLCVLFHWGVAAQLGLMEPWEYGFGALMDEWFRQALALVLVGFPVAFPCGVLMGAWIGRGR